MKLIEHPTPHFGPPEMLKAHYLTPIYKIGKTEWCMSVYTWSMYAGHSERVTGYFFRSSPDDYWKSEKKHPRYNRHDGLYAGLPKTLGGIYYTHEQEIQAALEGRENELKHAEPLPQLALM